MSKFREPTELSANLSNITPSGEQKILQIVENNPISLTQLSGVVITNPILDEVLKYDGINWINGEGGGGGTGNVESVNGKIGIVILNTDDILDTTQTNKYFNSKVNDATIQDGQILKYILSSGKYEPLNYTLASLNDTSVNAPVNNQFLRYNGTSSKFENQTVVIPTLTDQISSLGQVNQYWNDKTIINLPQGREALIYDGISGKWQNSDIVLNDILEINTAGLTKDDILIYDGVDFVNKQQKNILKIKSDYISLILSFNVDFNDTYNGILATLIGSPLISNSVFKLGVASLSNPSSSGLRYNAPLDYTENSFGVCFWARTSNTSATKYTLFSKQNYPSTNPNERGYSLYLNTQNGYIFFEMVNNRTLSDERIYRWSSVVNDGQFHFYLLNFNADTKLPSLYIDNVLLSPTIITNTLSTENITNSSEFCIGCKYNSIIAFEVFQGYVDQFIYYKNTTIWDGLRDYLWNNGVGIENIDVYKSQGVDFSALDGLLLQNTKEGDILKYTGGIWTNEQLEIQLNNISDVIITNPLQNDILTYNGSQFVNSAEIQVNRAKLTSINTETFNNGDVYFENGLFKLVQNDKRNLLNRFSTEISDNVLLNLSFNENFEDTSIYRNPVTLVGNPTIDNVNYKVGTGSARMTPNNYASYSQYVGNFNITDDFSVEFWYRLDPSITGVNTFFSKRNSFGYGWNVSAILTTNEFYTSLSCDGRSLSKNYTAPYTINDGQFHFCVFRHSALNGSRPQSCKFYVDDAQEILIGSVVQDGLLPGDDIRTSEPILVGSGNTISMNGWIDQITFYNILVDTNDILTHYNNNNGYEIILDFGLVGLSTMKDKALLQFDYETSNFISSNELSIPKVNLINQPLEQPLNNGDIVYNNEFLIRYNNETKPLMKWYKPEASEIELYCPFNENFNDYSINQYYWFKKGTDIRIDNTIFKLGGGSLDAKNENGLAFPKECFNFDYTDSFSIEFWAYITSFTDQFNVIMDKREYYTGYQKGLSVIFIDFYQTLRIELSNNSTNNLLRLDYQSLGLSINTWYHFVITHSSLNGNLPASVKVYKNSISLPQTIRANLLTGSILTNQYFYISTKSTIDDINGFERYLDNLICWKKELNQDEVNVAYNSGNGRELNFLFQIKATQILEDKQLLVYNAINNEFENSKTINYLDCTNGSENIILDATNPEFKATISDSIDNVEIRAIDLQIKDSTLSNILTKAQIEIKNNSTNDSITINDNNITKLIANGIEVPKFINLSNLYTFVDAGVYKDNCAIPLMYTDISTNLNQIWVLSPYSDKNENKYLFSNVYIKRHASTSNTMKLHLSLKRMDVHSGLEINVLIYVQRENNDSTTTTYYPGSLYGTFNSINQYYTQSFSVDIIGVPNLNNEFVKVHIIRLINITDSYEGGIGFVGGCLQIYDNEVY